jgi:hypothetical protein
VQPGIIRASSNDNIVIYFPLCHLFSMLIFSRLKLKFKLLSRIYGLIFAANCFCTLALADSDDVALTATNSPASKIPHYGFLNWLDPQSAYNQEFFPQPLLVDDTGLEDGEVEFSYLHTKAGDQHADAITVEVQKSFGLLTFELGVPYEWVGDSDDSAKGIGNINLEARYPLYQFVSAGGFFDTTLGAAMEAGIPVNTVVSKNAELDPEIFNDLKLGRHFSIQTVLGYGTTFGSGDEGGLQSFEYGFAFGYTMSHREMQLPGVQQFTPLVELTGETGLNKGESGQNSLLGTIGFRVDLKRLGDVQPSIGLGYVFPVDSGAREEVHWGIASNLTFEF